MRQGTAVDRRTWSPTDRPGERITVACPLEGVEVISVSGSNRHWCEAHDRFTLGVIHREQSGLVAEWRTRGRSLRTEGGEIMAIEPGDTHVTQRLSFPRVGANFDVVRFAPELAAGAGRALGSKASFHFSSPAVRDAVTFDALRSLIRAVAEGGDALEIGSACTNAVHALFSRLAEAPTQTGSRLNPVRDYRLRRVKDYLRANLSQRPTLADLEPVADLSQWRLCVLFKEAYGLSIGQYWNALRLAAAVRQLQQGAPVKLIVAELGYADEPHFWRLFKTHYGVAPGRWLSLYRANQRLFTR